MSLAKLYNTQVSFEEWFKAIGHTKADQFAAEDHQKRETMARMNRIIGLPFDKPVQFTVSDIVEKAPEFAAFMKEKGEELCALRLIPLEEGLPKYRMRGQTVKEVVSQWLPEQGVEPSTYRADFVPHTARNIWSTIFVVNEHGIFGEIIADGHHTLTQGFYTDNKPISFSFDFDNWTLDPHNEEALTYLRDMVLYIHVKDDTKKMELIQAVDAAFCNDYIRGYFETVLGEHGTWFVDYNKTLGHLFDQFDGTKKSSGTLSGNVAFAGSVKGVVRIVTDPSTAEFGEGDVLVCSMTSPDYIPLMKKASAVITDRGGVLCHAAIVCREMKKPCIVGTSNATEVLEEGKAITIQKEGSILLAGD